jgi:hypothetical protein
MSEIANPSEDTFWIITDGNSYAAGMTKAGRATTLRSGWEIWWSGTDFAQYALKCLEARIMPAVGVIHPD